MIIILSWKLWLLSRIPWKPFWLATQLYPQNDWLGGNFMWIIAYAHKPQCGSVSFVCPMLLRRKIRNLSTVSNHFQQSRMMFERAKPCDDSFYVSSRSDLWRGVASIFVNPPFLWPLGNWRRLLQMGWESHSIRPRFFPRCSARGHCWTLPAKTDSVESAGGDDVIVASEWVMITFTMKSTYMHVRLSLSPARKRRPLELDQPAWSSCGIHLCLCVMWTQTFTWRQYTPSSSENMFNWPFLTHHSFFMQVSLHFLAQHVGALTGSRRAQTPKPAKAQSRFVQLPPCEQYSNTGISSWPVSAGKCWSRFPALCDHW